MSLLSWLGQTIGLTNRFRKFWATFAGADASWSGQIVTSDTAMQTAALWRGIKLEAQTVGTLPLNTFETRGDADPVPVRQDNAYDLLFRVAPNEDMTTTEFWEAICGAHRLVGNAYALKKRLGDRIVALEIVDPEITEPFRDPRDFSLRYRGVDRAGNLFNVPQSEMFHLKGFSFGTDKGLSVVQYGAQSLGTMRAANKTAAKIFRSGLGTSGFIETNATFNDDDERKKLEKIFAEYQGSDSPDKLMILEAGMKFNRVSMSAVDAQLLATQAFGIEEIGRWLDMPPILLGHNSDGQTQWGTGVEAIIQTWLQLGLRATLTRIEKAINKRIIEPKDRGRFFVKFNIDALLRGDSTAQAALYSTMVQNGIWSRNEVRKLQDRPRSDDPNADALTCQVNLALLRDLGSQNEATVAAASNALRRLLGMDDPKNDSGPLLIGSQRPPVSVQIDQNMMRRRKERTTVTKHDERGRIVEFVREDLGE